SRRATPGFSAEAPGGSATRPVRDEGGEGLLRGLERAIPPQAQVGHGERHDMVRDHAAALDLLAVREHESHLAVRELAAARDARVAEKTQQASAARLAHHDRAIRRLHLAREELAAAG